MPAITKISVLEAFIKHNSISVEDLQTEKIYDNLNYLQERYNLFWKFIKELINEDILEEHRDIPKFWWTVKNMNKAIELRNKLIKDEQPVSHTYIETQNTTGDIYGGTVIQSGRESRFENLSIATPISTPTNAATKSKTKTFWSKALLFIWDNIWKFIIGVAIAYAVFKFGWKK